MWMVKQITGEALRLVRKIDLDLIKELKKDNRALRRTMQTDVFQTMDTRGLEYQIQQNKGAIGRHRREIRKIDKALKTGKINIEGKIYKVVDIYLPY